MAAPALPASLTLHQMSRFQWLAIGMCIVLIMLDGFDVMVMAFTAPHISADWSLSGKELGLMFSSGLVGMALGSLVLGPLADRIGRRTLILWCLLILTVGMALSTLAQNAVQLAGLRVFTGLGIGGLLAGVGVIAAEYASPRWRSTAVALQATGYPIGATLGGLLAGQLLEHWGWRSVFAFGALCSLVCIPLVLALLPESLDFLVSRRPAGALERLNALLTRMQRPTLRELPPPPQIPSKAGYAALFTPALRRNTVLIALCFFMHMFAFYFVLSWTPKLLVQLGLSAQQGVTGGVLLNVGGIVGGSVFGWLASRVFVPRLTAASFLLAALGMAAFAAFGSRLDLAFPIAAAIGAALFGAMAGLYSLAPMVFGASVRTTGLGWAIGIGRVGAIVSPLAAGVLVDSGWQPANLYYVLALPLIVAIVAVLAMRLIGDRAGT